jgi:hypothetical protein
MEMLEILIETQGFVDLYYNDFYGLELVLNETRKKKEKPFFID